MTPHSAPDGAGEGRERCGYRFPDRTMCLLAPGPESHPRGCDHHHATEPTRDQGAGGGLVEVLARDLHDAMPARAAGWDGIAEEHRQFFRGVARRLLDSEVAAGGRDDAAGLSDDEKRLQAQVNRTIANYRAGLEGVVLPSKWVDLFGAAPDMEFLTDQQEMEHRLAQATARAKRAEAEAAGLRARVEALADRWTEAAAAKYDGDDEADEAEAWATSTCINDLRAALAEDGGA